MTLTFRPHFENKEKQIPLYTADYKTALIRIDQVEKEGRSKVRPGGDSEGGNVASFPIPMKPPAVE